MANAYLINAMYGPKSTTPTILKVEDKSHEIAQEQHPTSLAERLYGSSPTPRITAITNPYARQIQQSVIKDEIQDIEEERERWAPTGSNQLPVGVLSGKAYRFNSLRLMQLPPSKTPANLRDRLTRPAERYFPPPGPYYDQYSLALVLEIEFTSDKCWTCWRPRDNCAKLGPCRQTCKVCGTTDHPGQTCPSLYCTQSWFHDLGHHNRSDATKDQVRQFRPTRAELKILKSMGLVLQSTKHNATIIPNMAHPLAQQFYHNKAEPSVVTTPSSGNAAMEPMTGRKMLTRSDAKPAAPAPTPPKTGTQVDVSRDPRLKGRFAYITALSSAKVGHLDSVTIVGTDTTSVESRNESESKTESRLQELEDEILKLRIENVAKDREIRKLMAENERLRDAGCATGNKRQRI